MQFQVPQFIESEDKVVGPFSLRQFAYVGVAGALSGALYLFVVSWLWIVLSIFIFAIAFAFAFVRIEGRPFLSIVTSAFNFYWKPQTYVWQPEHKAVAPSRATATAESSSALEDILAKSAEKARSAVIRVTPRAAEKPTMPAQKPSSMVVEAPREKPISRENVSTGSTLHKIWEEVQTGVKKTSDKEFLERKMEERYQIFQRLSGDRKAAKRVDYR
jgi:hypothetical protein